MTNLKVIKSYKGDWNIEIVTPGEFIPSENLKVDIIDQSKYRNAILRFKIPNVAEVKTLIIGGSLDYMNRRFCLLFQKNLGKTIPPLEILPPFVYHSVTKLYSPEILNGFYPKINAYCQDFLCKKIKNG